MEKVGAFTDRTTEGGEWRSGNPASGQQATPMLAAYFNMLQRELVSVVESAGIELDKDDDGQLLQAIRRLRGGAATNFGQWLWSSSTAGNPGTGRIALNNATPGSATTLFIDEISAEDVDFAQSLGLLRAGDTITLQERDTAELSHRLRVTGLAVDHGTYRSIPVDYVSGSGGLPENDAIVSVLLTQAGASDASIPLFMAQWWPNRASIPAGYAPADGQLLSRATFPDAWAGIEAGNVPTVADGTWLSTPVERGKYTAGDGATSFRLPDYNGKAAGSLGAVFMRGDGALSAAVAGAIQSDAFQGHKHKYGGILSAVGSGAQGVINYSAASAGDVGDATSDGVNGAPRTASETRPLNVTGCWIVKIFGSVTNPGSADAAQLATDMAALITRVTALEARPFSVQFVSSWAQMVNSGLLTFTHGLGVEPTSIELVAECITADGGYAVGDRVRLSPGAGVSSINGIQPTVYANETNIFAQCSANGFAYLPKGGGSGVTLVHARWQLRVRAWA
ncbi:phage tail protein [Ectopseudomonas toyotomiensis]|uniref:Phage tail protein n=1 Tax=Ectopseudomonas toyotomiensis TaxID=554344 RepID=A0A1I5PEK2_9GAMM|nr:phage tail protein [Pseudomonas toyotomiensis]SFP32514.1 hypothetical protein SAMN05216177_102281 [Pseudomonas toyotomiensis]